jgi:hypothetical protein
LHQQLLLRRLLRWRRSSRVGSRLTNRIGCLARCIRSCASRVAGGISCLSGGHRGIVGRFRFLLGRVSSLVCSAAAAAASAQQKRRSEGAKSRFDLHLVTPKGLESYKDQPTEAN